MEAVGGIQLHHIELVLTAVVAVKVALADDRSQSTAAVQWRSSAVAEVARQPATGWHYNQAELD